MELAAARPTAQCTGGTSSRCSQTRGPAPRGGRESAQTMPANLSPDYKKAEAEYRKSRDAHERLDLLREMLKTIPKHKGTEHIQADIKARIKELTEELAAPHKGGARTGPAQAVRPEGAAQIALLGPPNAGKSSLHARLTHSHAEIGPYPFTTKAPRAGMLPHEDIHFQLVDLPPLSAEFMEPWMPNALQPADAALLVIDLSDPACVEQVAAIRERLDAKRVTLEERWGAAVQAGTRSRDAGHLTAAFATHATADDGGDDQELADPFRIHLPTLLLANKCDLDPDPAEAEVLEELLGVRYPALSVSATTGQGLDRIAPFLFEGLGIVRVYTKAPGKPPATGRPYTLRRGETVTHVARLVHRELAASLKFARVWGSGEFQGQQVGREHVVQDGDIVELHT